MDYQKAIETHINECRHRIDVIRNHMNTNGDADKDSCFKNIKVLKTAISAMQELQEYHETGLSAKQVSDNICELSATKRVLGHYQQIGTLEEVREAVEKKKPKTPTYDGDGYAPDGSFVWDEWLCPCCGARFEVDYEEHDYCPNCGQHILWEVEDEQ